MTAVKNNNRIHTRSPFYINAVPTTGTISRANLTLKLQTGRRFAVGPMTDLKTYTLTSTNAIDNVIVFNISPLITDYLEKNTERYDIKNVRASTSKELLYVLWDLSVTRTGGTDDSSGYYVGVEGYSKFSDGVNWQPVTDATGNYGDPVWSPVAAKGTDRTIMATQCYRQIGEDSYAIMPVYMGEFDENNVEKNTFIRIAFGNYTDAFTFSGSSNPLHDYNINSSDLRLNLSEFNQLYIPVGKKNMSNDWVDGYDFLTIGHCINRSETSAGLETTTAFLSNSDFQEILPSLEAGEKIRIDFADTSIYNISVNDTLELILSAFDDCGQSYAQTDVTIRINAINPTSIDFKVVETGVIRAQVSCFIGSSLDILATLQIPIISTSNDIAIVNDNPLIRYEIICEPKHRVVDFFFVNRWGAWDCFSFLKASRESIDVKSETHYKSIGSISSNAYTYDVNNNQIQRYNIKANKTYTVNTGYINESFNLLLEEILLTPQAFMIWDGERVPVNVTDTRQELKEHVNEKVINYTLELTAANDHINNVV